MFNRLGQASHKIEVALEEASPLANLSCTIGGVALITAGLLLIPGSETPGLVAVGVGEATLSAGLYPPAFRRIGLLPPRQNNENTVQ
jgi:hypothetical protein